MGWSLQHKGAYYVIVMQQSSNAQSGQQTGRKSFNRTFEIKQKDKKFKYVILSTDNLVTLKKYPKGSYSGDIKVAYSFASHTPKNTQSE